MNGVVFDKDCWYKVDRTSHLHRLAKECDLHVFTATSRADVVSGLAAGTWIFLLVHVEPEEWPLLVDALRPEQSAVWVSGKDTGPRPGINGKLGGYGVECCRRLQAMQVEDVLALSRTFSSLVAVTRLRDEQVVPTDLRGVLRLRPADSIRLLAKQLRSFLENPLVTPRSEEERLADVCQVLRSGQFPVATIGAEMGYGPDGHDALSAEAPELLLLLEWFQGDDGAGSAGLSPSIDLVKAASRQINDIWNALEAI